MADQIRNASADDLSIAKALLAEIEEATKEILP